MKEHKYTTKIIADRLLEIHQAVVDLDNSYTDGEALDYMLHAVKHYAQLIREDERFFINARFLPVLLTKTVNASAFCPDEDSKLRKFLIDYKDYSVDIPSMTSTIRSQGWCRISQEESRDYRVQLTMKPNSYGK